MKNVRILLGTFFFALGLLTGCSGISGNKNEVESTDTVPDSVKTASDRMVAEPTTPLDATSELLQGKWQHTEDKSNYLVFEGNRRRETAGGNDQWQEEAFVLSDRCVNDFNKNDGGEPEKNRYISCPESDLCWYIVQVDEEILSLSYMGRGNTLTYQRVK